MDAGDVRFYARDAASFHSFIPIYTIRIIQKYEFEALISWKTNSQAETNFH